MQGDDTQAFTLATIDLQLQSKRKSTVKSTTKYQIHNRKVLKNCH